MLFRGGVQGFAIDILCVGRLLLLDALFDTLDFVAKGSRLFISTLSQSIPAGCLGLLVAKGSKLSKSTLSQSVTGFL